NPIANDAAFAVGGLAAAPANASAIRRPRPCATAEVLREEVARPGTRHPILRVTAGRRIGAANVPASASSSTRWSTKPGGSGGNPASTTPSLEQRQRCPAPPPTNGSPGCWNTSEHKRHLRRVVESQYTLPLRCWRWRYSM